MTNIKSVPSVSVKYSQSGNSTKSNELGMRVMQERAYEKRGEQYLLIKSPPASGKSRALMFIALDKLANQNITSTEKDKLKDIFKRDTRLDEDLNFTLMLIKKYNIIKECYKKAEHFINLASNSLTVFKDSEEKKILENLTSFTLERSF